MVLRHWPRHRESLLGLGRTLVGAGLENEALPLLVAAEQQAENPTAEALLHIGTEQASLGALDKAQATLEKAAKRFPNHPFIHYNLAKIYSGLNEPENALQHYEKTTATAPEFAEGHNNLGSVHFKAAQYEQAERAFRRALELRPTYKTARWNLIQLLLQQKDLDAYTIEMNIFLNQWPYSPEVKELMKRASPFLAN